MFTFADRLATFAEPVQLSQKRRNSTAKKKQQHHQQTVTISWPHITPTPEQLARAGFFYKPSTTSPDSVTCFLCHKSLDGWDLDDDPAVEHLSHVPDCGWAICTGVELRSRDSGRTEAHPYEPQMAEARRATFADKWPHEDKKGWKCKVQKMVDAGWSYEPLPEAEDCVKCFYCGVCLDGWEPKDDPWDEHERRSPECQFFNLMGSAKNEGKEARAVVRRTSHASRLSRLPTQLPVVSGLDTHASFVSDHTDADEGDTVMSTTSTKRRAVKSRKRGSTATNSVKNTRTRTRKPSTSVQAGNQQQHDNKTTSSAASGFPSNEYRQNAATSATRAATFSNIEDSGQLQSTASVSSPRSATDISLPQKKTSRRKATKNQPGEDLGSTEVDLKSHVELMQSMEQGVETSRKHKQTTGGGSAIDSSIVAVDLELTPMAIPKATRGKKRTSDGVEKLNTAMVPPAGLIQASYGDTMTSTSQTRTNRASETTQVDPASSKKIALTPAHHVQQTTPESVCIGESIKQQTVSSSRNKPLQDSFEPGVEINLANHEGQSLKHRGARNSASQAADIDKIQINHSAVEVNSPSGPQSSDAENQPPSSKSFVVVADTLTESSSVQPMPPPVLTPVASPGRRGVGTSGVQSSIPWEPNDLESAFLVSPSAHAYATLGRTLEQTTRSLTDVEKQMSVEDWILWNAKSAEERLKGECERLINVFEREGVRALRTMEGIECA